MKAIQIYDMNRDLLEAWGEKEELTWANSFSSLIGAVLVVDDKLPQGYAVKTTSAFCDEYLWWTNFGTKGWSDIKRISDVGLEPEPESIYIVWDKNADSWSGSRTMMTIHKTLEGAIEAIPENLRTESMKRETDETYVAHFTYYAVEKRALQD